MWPEQYQNPLIFILYNMSYCHFVQNNFYSYDKEIGEKHRYHSLCFIAKSSQNTQILGRKSNRLQYCSVLNAHIILCIV